MVCWFDKVFLNSINFDCRNKENPKEDTISPEAEAKEKSTTNKTVTKEIKRKTPAVTLAKDKGQKRPAGSQPERAAKKAKTSGGGTGGVPEVNKFTKVSGMYVLIIVSIIIT